MKKEWKREVARDFLAIASWIFFFLVIARLAIGPYLPWVYQFIVSGVVLALLLFYIKESDGYVARGLVLLILTGLFYNTLSFTVFSIVAYFLLIASTLYLGSKPLGIIKGVILGAISTVVGYYLGALI